jgi:hypothetical protein
MSALANFYRRGGRVSESAEKTSKGMEEREGRK